jgi:hypothetical protein
MRVPQANEARRNQVKGRKHTPEQVVRKLREADRLLGQGKTVAEDIRKAASTMPVPFRRRR